MKIKETLEQSLDAWKEVKKVLFLARTYNELKFDGYYYIGELADQEIKALEHDLKELGEEQWKKKNNF